MEGKAVVELEGTIGEERDLDADAGALLVCPERIVEVSPLNARLMDEVAERLEAEGAAKS
ncbi:MAG: hypothetical protein ACJ75S_11445 [Solirubrobacterales bacterium]